MQRQLLELESILRQMIDEHRKLLQHLEAQQKAMKALDLQAMDAAAKLQEGCRLRIATLENRRRALIAQLSKLLRHQGELTVKQIAELSPQQGPGLLKLRDDLKALVGQIGTKAQIAGKLAGAVLGHLNTAVRLLAGAAQQAGVYTKQGVPQVAARIGVLEAVG